MEFQKEIHYESGLLLENLKKKKEVGVLGDDGRFLSETMEDH